MRFVLSYLETLTGYTGVGWTVDGGRFSPLPIPTISTEKVSCPLPLPAIIWDTITTYHIYTSAWFILYDYKCTYLSEHTFIRLQNKHLDQTNVNILHNICMYKYSFISLDRNVIFKHASFTHRQKCDEIPLYL